MALGSVLALFGCSGVCLVAMSSVVDCLCQLPEPVRRENQSGKPGAHCVGASIPPPWATTNNRCKRGAKRGEPMDEPRCRPRSTHRSVRHRQRRPRRSPPRAPPRRARAPPLGPARSGPRRARGGRRDARASARLRHMRASSWPAPASARASDAPGLGVRVGVAVGGWVSSIGNSTLMALVHHRSRAGLARSSC